MNIKKIGFAFLLLILGLVSQQTHLFNGTVLDNICLENSPEHLEKVLVFCQNKGFESYFKQFPQGIFTLVGEEGINLSGGQKQLLALARALYHQPQVLILDEATAALDQETEKFALNLLQQEKRNGMAIVFVTHRRYTLPNFADKTYQLAHNRLELVASSCIA